MIDINVFDMRLLRDEVQKFDFILLAKRRKTLHNTGWHPLACRVQPRGTPPSGSCLSFLADHLKSASPHPKLVVALAGPPLS